MPIVIVCPSCSARVKAPDAAAGQSLPCPKCKVSVSIPGAGVSRERQPPMLRAIPLGSRDDEERPREKRPRGLSTGAVIGIVMAAIVVPLLLMVVVIAVMASRRGSPKPVEANQQARIAQEPPPVEAKAAKQPIPKLAAEDDGEGEAYDSTKPIRRGNVEIGISHATIRKVSLTDLNRKSQSKESLLEIGIVVSNLSETRKIDYHSWAGKFSIFERNPARLADEFNNSYNRIHFGFGVKVDGQQDRESIYPKKSVTDILVFEPPVSNAKNLVLTLPLRAVEGKGDLRIRIRGAVK